jgi:hypothetical protein
LSYAIESQTPVIESSTSDQIAESQSGKTSAEESLMRLAAGARFFRGDDDRFHARVLVGNRHEILGVAAFREWLVDGYAKKCRKLPSHWSVSRVVEALEARARFDGGTPSIFIRVGRDQSGDDSAYYLDLGDPSGRAIWICAQGWVVVDNPDIHFRRPRGMLPLPLPSHDGSIELLRPFVNLSEPEFRLLIAWMAAALRPDGPYPVLVLHGEQGSAKSTLTRIIRKLIDPQAAPLLAEPGSTRDLMVTALNGWLLAYDNLSALRNSLSDSSCRLATGGGFAGRMLFSNDNRCSFHAERPIILNGIDQFVRRGDLADRSLSLDLPSIGQTSRRTQREFWASFAAVYPLILGGLLDAVAGALRELPSVDLPELPRMADFAQFGEAVGRGLGWPAATFISAYNDNHRESATTALRDSVVAKAVFEVATWSHTRVWTRSPADLLEVLDDAANEKMIASARWPKTPGMLGNELRRLAPLLRAHGIDVTFSRNHKSRMITLAFGPTSDYSADTL